MEYLSRSGASTDIHVTQQYSIHPQKRLILLNYPNYYFAAELIYSDEYRINAKNL